MWKLLCWFVSTFFLLSMATQGQGSKPGATILDVERIGMAEAVQREAAPVQLRLGTFFDQDASASGPEIFRVTWRPEGNALPAGVQLRFEYRQDKVRTVQHLEIEYPFPVQNQRMATFEVSARAIAAGGPVRAWRVVVLQNGRTIAERGAGNLREGAT
jgi:hypothetical protein